jgi:predicted DNA-binding transcriptional regulator AlpA
MDGMDEDADFIERRQALSGQDIAKLFGRSRDWWYENRASLIASNNFPKPLPGPGRRKWSRSQVERACKSYEVNHGRS